MKAALDRFTDEELRVDRIDRGHGFVASPFVQHEVYREAVYIFYGKLSGYLKALERDAGRSGPPGWDESQERHRGRPAQSMNQTIAIEMTAEARPSISVAVRDSVRSQVVMTAAVSAMTPTQSRRDGREYVSWRGCVMPQG